VNEPAGRTKVVNMNFKTSLIYLSSYLGLPKLFAGSPEHSITTLLYHKFIYSEENIVSGRARLKRELEWLRHHYSPLTVKAAVTGVSEGKLPEYPLVITADDAFIDLLDVCDIFQEFDMPLTVYTCAGWTTNASEYEGEDDVVLQLLDFFQWYVGESEPVRVHGQESLYIDAALKDENIDTILGFYHAGDQEILAEIWDNVSKIITSSGNRSICSWSELRDLESQGLTIGSHTVTHCGLSDKSDIRLNFEVKESRRIIRERLGACDSFAYPHGTSDVWSIRTRDQIYRAGYEAAFLTHPGFASYGSDVFCLPRIVMPNRILSFEEYRAHVKGGTIPIQAVKNFLHFHK